MGEEDDMKRRHHSPEQIVRELREADRMLGARLWWRCVSTWRTPRRRIAGGGISTGG
jgi:hypothetical protein